MNLLKHSFVLLVLICISNACVPQFKKVENVETFGGDMKSTQSIPANTPETSGGAKETPTPTPFTGQEFEIKGENKPTKIESDFETSVKNQESPTIWLQYLDENEKPIKTKTSSDINVIIEQDWINWLTYLYEKYENEDKSNLAQSQYEKDLSFIKALNGLRQLEGSLPNKRKTFTEDEAKDILSTQGRLAVQKFKELQKHFSIKSS